MIVGFNHNIMHKDLVYHVQTEDSGVRYAHIITHLFVGGNIIHSKKSSYTDTLEKDLDELTLEDTIRTIMQEQHKSMIRELKSGKFDHIGTRKDKGELLTEGLLDFQESNHSSSNQKGEPPLTENLEEIPSLCEPPTLDDIDLAVSLPNLNSTDTTMPKSIDEEKSNSSISHRVSRPRFLKRPDSSNVPRRPGNDAKILQKPMRNVNEVNKFFDSSSKPTERSSKEATPGVSVEPTILNQALSKRLKRPKLPSSLRPKPLIQKRNKRQKTQDPNLDMSAIGNQRMLSTQPEHREEESKREGHHERPHFSKRKK